MKIVFNHGEALDLILDGLRGQDSEAALIPPVMDREKLWARFVFDDNDYLKGVEVSDEEDEDDKKTGT